MLNISKYNHFSFLLFIILISIILYFYLFCRGIDKKLSGDVYKLNNIISKFKNDLDSLKSQNTNLLNEINQNKYNLNPSISSESDDEDVNDKLKSILDEIPDDDDDDDDVSSPEQRLTDTHKINDSETIKSVNSESLTEDNIDLSDDKKIDPLSINDSLTQLKNEKLETLKDLCKNLKISNKGTKEVLAQRIFEKQSETIS